MRVKVESAELERMIFFGKKSHGPKLQASAAYDLVYDHEHKHLEVSWGGVTANAPRVNCWVPMKETAKAAAVVTPAPLPPPVVKSTAQASSPTDHVFGGPGKGQTGQKPKGKVVL